MRARAPRRRLSSPTSAEARATSSSTSTAARSTTTGWYALLGSRFGRPGGASFFVEAIYRGIEATVQNDPDDIDDIDLRDEVDIALDGIGVNLGVVFTRRRFYRVAASGSSPPSTSPPGSAGQSRPPRAVSRWSRNYW